MVHNPRPENPRHKKQGNAEQNQTFGISQSLLHMVDKLIQEGYYVNRSEFIRHAIQTFQKKEVAQNISWYTLFPDYPLNKGSPTKQSVSCSLRESTKKRMQDHLEKVQWHNSISSLASAAITDLLWISVCQITDGTLNKISFPVEEKKEKKVISYPQTVRQA